MTAVSLLGIFLIFFNPFISAVLIAIVIIIATKAAIGMEPIQSFKRIIIIRRDIPEERVDNLDLPPFSVFITD